MKRRIAMNSLKGMYSVVFRAGDNDLQHIFSGIEPQYYNAGVYGWNCDVYGIYSAEHSCNMAFTTGYRNMRGHRIPYDIIDKYDSIAREIIAEYSFKDYEKKQELLEANRINFIREVMQEVH